MLRRLDAAARGKLTLVAAPQGCGKSTLLAQWASTRRDLGALLSFDGIAHARDLAALLVTPLERRIPALVDLRLWSGESGEVTMGDEFLGRLTECYDSLPETVVVLDCLDGLDSLALRDEVLAFVARTAPQIHFVVAVRSQRSVPQVARDIRLRDDVAYLHEDDLLFDHDEARDLLRRESRRRLDDADVSALVARTEGWATGLHLAALSLRAADDVAGWVEGFGGADEFVESYFTEAVMPQYSAGAQRFLLTTSALDHLSGSLCDAVTGSNDAATMLQLLDTQSVLRRRALAGTDVFVHRRLFREYLHSRFALAEPDGEQRVLRRAADWCLEHDDIEETVRYLIAARDWERVLDAVAATGREMHEQARPAVALTWLESVPHSLRESRHEVVLQHATLRGMVGDTLGAEEILRRLGEPQSLPTGVQAMAETLRATWVEAHLAPDAAIDAADNALRMLDSLRADELPQVFGLATPDSLRTVASVSRARAVWYQGDVAAARTALERLLEDGDLYPTWHINILGTLALLEAWSGLLGVAQQYATYAFRIAAESRRPYVHPSLVDAYLAMAHVLLERDDPTRAGLVLGDAFEAAARTARYPMSLALHAVERAHFELACSRPRAALDHLRETEKRQRVLPPLIAARLRTMKARALLAVGEPALAERALDLDAAGQDVEVAATAVHLALARSDAVTARQLLVSWPQEGGPWSELNCALAQALIDDADGERREALEGMEEVVAAAEGEGHVLLFLDAGSGAQRLLRALFRAHPTPYLRQLVRPEQAAPPRTGTSTGDLRSPLSERELLVLRYLPSRMTHAEIAAQLFVSLNTVKTQVRSIYTKLGAKGRKDAIDRAEALGLV